MIKSELVQRGRARNPHLYERDAEHVVNAVLEGIVSALAHGDRVELRGFGAFTVKARPPRPGRNPRTGEQVAVDKKYVSAFKAGKDLRERLLSNRALPQPLWISVYSRPTMPMSPGYDMSMAARAHSGAWCLDAATSCGQ